MAIDHLDIVDIELTSGSLHRSFLSHSIGLNDNNANSFGVRVFRNGEPVNLESGWVQGFFHNSHGENIALTQHGTFLYNVAYVTLPQACYNYEGQFTLAIKVISQNTANTVTMRIIDGVVVNTNTDNPVAPVETVPTYEEILALYGEMLEAKEGSVRFDITQELTDTQKAKARENIGAATSEDFDNLGLYIADGYICQDITSD